MNLKARFMGSFTKKHCAFFAMIALAIALDQVIKFFILDFYANAPSPHSKVFEAQWERI